MRRDTTQSKKSLYLGLALIASGILFNKWFIETTLVADEVIRSSSYSLIIILFEIISVIIGSYLLIKQPDIRMPSKRIFFLACISIFTAALLVEIGARIWLNVLAVSVHRQDAIPLFSFTSRIQ